MSKNESYTPSKPISINTNTNQNNTNNYPFGSWSPISGNIFGTGKYAFPPSSSNLPPLSPVSPSSSLNSQPDIPVNAPNLGRRMSLNIGATSLATPFFQTSTANNNIEQVTQEVKKDKPIIRRSRTVSVSETGTAGLAEKWGFGIKSSETSKEYSQTLPRVRKSRADFIRENSGNKENRSKSPMRDLILKGQFDM